VREPPAPNVGSVQPSSLIFLVIIAIWAAYFLQYWVRRREHLATARSVDRFSESMRVLERRAALVEPDVAAPQRRSYAVSPAKASRPQLHVKRAVPSPVPDNVGAPADGELSTPAARPVKRGRRVRGLSFLGSIALLVAAVPVAAFSLIPWLGLLLPGVAMVVSFLWIRRGVAAERAARRGRSVSEVRRARAGGETARPAADRGRPGAGRADHAGDEAPPAPEEAQPAGAAAQTADGEPTASPESGFYDIEAVEASATAAARQTVAAGSAAAAPAAAATSPALQSIRPLVDEDDIPLTWDPVPVPRPTYTMKAKAERHAAPPAEASAEHPGEHPAYARPQVARAVGD
jgi:membrane protein implicated in regulation of membrane protease activity